MQTLEPEDYEGEPFPEMLAISNIIDRLCGYIIKNQTGVKISVAIDLQADGKSVAQSYVLTAIPHEHNDEERFNKEHKDCTDIVKEEFQALYPNASTDLQIPIQKDMSPKDPTRKVADQLQSAKKKMRNANDIPGPENPKPGNTFMGFDSYA
jgi:hypothetical protein